MVSTIRSAKWNEGASNHNEPLNASKKKSSHSNFTNRREQQKSKKKSKFHKNQVPESSVSSVTPSLSKNAKMEARSGVPKKTVVSSNLSRSSRLQRDEHHAKVQTAVASAFLTEDSQNRNHWSLRGGYNVHKGTADDYGKGSPTDRLQFGYSPSIAEEAICFHQRFSSSQWIQERQRVGKLVFLKHQKIPALNCEMIIPALKLREHWKQQSTLHAEYHNGAALHLRKVDDEKFDSLLKLFASKQRMTVDI